MPDRVPGPARALGFAGLLPQGAAVLGAMGGPDWRYGALAFAFAYAALIFSFLGGLWWGLAAAAGQRAPGWLWGAAVAPSLLALACCWPWLVGARWPGPSLIVLGLAILVSPLVDLRLTRRGLAPAWWPRLRLPLSAGLGVLTLVAGLLA